MTAAMASQPSCPVKGTPMGRWLREEMGGMMSLSGLKTRIVALEGQTEEVG